MKTLLSYKVIHSEYSRKRFLITVEQKGWLSKTKFRTFECCSNRFCDTRSFMQPYFVSSGTNVSSYSEKLSEVLKDFAESETTEWTSKDGNNK